VAIGKTLAGWMLYSLRYSFLQSMLQKRLLYKSHASKISLPQFMHRQLFLRAKFGTLFVSVIYAIFTPKNLCLATNKKRSLALTKQN